MTTFLIFLLFIFGFGLGGLIIYLICRPTMKNIIQQNQKTLQENNQIESNNKQLIYQNQILKTEEDELKGQVANVQSEYNTISAKRDEIKNSLDDLEKQSAQAAEKFYEAARQAAQISFDQEAENISIALEKDREQAKQIYFETTQECVLEFQKEIDFKSQELIQIQETLEQERENVNAAVEAAKRRQEMENQQDFYRLVLTDEDIVEIKRLRDVLPYLRDKTPLNKVIYKVYYEKPLTDMIGRVVGAGQHTGIYKITNLNSKKCYVGQSVNIADRWRQHVKRGVGAEDWTRNKLYPAMYSLGVENFSFEIIEECDRSKLNEREKYWTEFFHAQDFGYSIRSG